MNNKRCWQTLKYIGRQLLRSRVAAWLGMFITLGSAMLVVNVYLVYSISSSSRSEVGSSLSDSNSQETKSPILWIYHKTDRPLGHVITVFNRIGYSLGGPTDDWSVLWSHEYPFKSLPPSIWDTLKPHQKINHFPATGCFTFKPQLAALHFPFVPKAFQLPKQADKLKKEAASHPDRLWVQKGNNHRGIRVKPIKMIDLEKEGSFVQQLISNPLLIDGRKFDIGVYTVITSMNPLRVYVYQEEVLLRFCSEDYLPFNTVDTRKYVVEDDYTPPSEFSVFHSDQLPSLKAMIVEQKFSNKEAFNFVLRRRGHQPNVLWEKVYDAIRKVLVHCEPNYISYSKRYSLSSSHFFELVRFDFVIDEDLNVWLMEVNLSPNLSSDHFPRNRFMYEQILFNMLSLVGLLRGAAASDESMRYNGQYESIMLVNDRDIQVPMEECVDGACKECNSLLVCKLCAHCRSDSETFTLKTAFLEHVSRRNLYRVFPPSPLFRETDHQNYSSSKHKEVIVKDYKLSPENYVMAAWFDGKCKADKTWCTYLK